MAWDAPVVLGEGLRSYIHRKEMPADRKKQEICKLRGNVFLVIEQILFFLKCNFSKHPELFDSGDRGFTLININ